MPPDKADITAAARAFASPQHPVYSAFVRHCAAHLEALAACQLDNPFTHHVGACKAENAAVEQCWNYRLDVYRAMHGAESPMRQRRRARHEAAS